MRYLSVCSGIEAATVAWHQLGWQAAAFSEIEKFPRQVLAHHYPEVPLHGDFTTIKGDEHGTIDLLVGGTPCQSFSVAGLRKGLDDPRGNLMLEYGALARRTGARWLVWENVPGVLSANGGRDFGTFLGMLAQLGYGFAYRVLDAQYFGVAQRRRRVFVVGYLGGWRRAAAVLFERHSLSGNPAPSRKAGKAVAALTANGVGTCGADDNQGQAGHLIATSTGEISHCLNAGGMGRQDYETETMVVHGTQDPCVSDIAFAQGRNNGGENVLCLPINTQIATRGNALGERTGFGIGENCEPGFTLQAAHSHAVAYARAFSCYAIGNNVEVQIPMQVRRLTPVECERLQGFPDNYTDIQPNGKPTPDGPRYKALGNSMAVPVMAWIGKRIQQVDRM